MTRKVYSGKEKRYLETDEIVINRTSSFDLIVIGKHGRDIQRIPSFVIDAGVSPLDEVLTFVKIITRREVSKVDEELIRKAVEEHLSDMKESLI